MIQQEMVLEDGSKLFLVHFVYRSPAGVVQADGKPLIAGGTQTWKVACAPQMAELGEAARRPFPWHRTEEITAVTCLLCQQSQAFLDEVRKQQTVVRVETLASREGVHLLIPGSGEQRDVLACVPNLVDFRPVGGRRSPWQRSDDPRAVTCPLCRKTTAFAAAAQRLQAAIPGWRP